MKVLLSSHLDRVIQDYDLGFRNGVHTGLLDNFIGVLTTYLALYDDRNLMDMERSGRVVVWHNKGEEWGTLTDPPPMENGDVAIVIDVACRKGVDFYLSGIQGIQPAKLKDVIDGLKWEGFNFGWKKFDGNPDDEDETWAWKKKDIATISFEIPIYAPGDGWHRVQQDSAVAAVRVKAAAQGLKRLLVYLLT
jgi:hypothetical protein